jgi:serine phosphatase RsbU (regulator of sigma subunit)/anti-sigma regulatory factor (Ser/Thr protein kinase)
MSEGRAAAARRFAAYVHWAQTPLGHIDGWPPALRQAWDWALGCPVPVVLFVGPDLHMIYNEAYADVLGGHHPRAFAAPAADILGDVWEEPRLADLEAAVLVDDSFVHEDSTLVEDPAHRQRQFLRVGSTVRDDGRVVALLNVVVETSGSADRARAVSHLATALTVAVTVDDVCKTVLRQAASAFDLISATLLLPSAGEGAWRMARRHRIEQLSPDEERLPLIWSEAPPEVAAAAEVAITSGRTTISPNGDLITVPLRAGPARAVLSVSRPPSSVPRDAMEVVTAFTDLVGEALGRAVVFDAERSTAELLQRTLLPANLPQCDEVSIAARYEPVSEGTVAGGDFYDSFFLTDGRIAFLIGDVVGRGVMAATVMGQVRAAARGAALSNPEGSTVMAALDRVVDDLDALWPIAMPLGNQRARPGMAFGGELFVTMLFGVVDPLTGAVELASAGHPAPVVLAGLIAREGGRPRVTRATMTVGPPLGIGGVRPVTTLALEVGDILVAFTDGLLERRGENLGDGEGRLLEVLEAAGPGSPRRVAQHVVDVMVQSSGQEDDTAVLAVGRSPADHRRASIVVPPMPESVKAARDWTRAQLAEWGVPDGTGHTVVTGISELITNAVLHAGTESHLGLDLDSGMVSVTVADSGNRGEPLLTGADTMAVRGRGLSLVKAISDAFGAHRTSAGTTVWFEVELDDVSTPIRSA